MDTLTTHPSTAQQATAFTAPSSLSMPGGMMGATGNVTPPAEKDGYPQGNGVNGAQNGQQLQKGVDASQAPSTPAATPGAAATHGVSGIVPTLQNIVATVNLDCRLDLKTIALHARNAEYNPKVLLTTALYSSSFMC